MQCGGVIILLKIIRTLENFLSDLFLPDKKGEVSEERGKCMARLIECLGIGLAITCFVIGLTQIIISVFRGMNHKKEKKNG